MRVAIHQPNFCPHSGFFEKMKQVDLFIILGHCQFEKNNYQNRFFDGNKWQTMTVSKKIENINVKQYLNPFVDWEKITKEHTKLKVFDYCIDWSILKTNRRIIELAANIMGIETKILPDFATDVKGTDRLIEILQMFNATTYVSGISGKNYMDLEKFKEANIKLEFQDKTESIPFTQLL